MKVDVYRFDPRLWNRELIGTAAFNRESPRWISKVATMTMPNTNSFVPNDLYLMGDSCEEEAQLRLISRLRGLYRKAFPASCHVI
jgi:hypothetical protein